MNPEAMIPHGLALRAYFAGESAAQLIIRREDGREDLLAVSQFFRSEAKFTALESAALKCCQGHVLDIGAGTGLHSLFLQSQGLSVTAIDISAQAVRIMKKRGVQKVQRADIFEYEGGPFDTLLMLGHGIGMVEDLLGLDRFLAHAYTLARTAAPLLVHSLDIRQTEDPSHLAYQEATRQAGRYVGEVRLQFEYQGTVGPYCGWLHIDPDTLQRHAEIAGWGFEIIYVETGGEYLARLEQRRAI